MALQWNPEWHEEIKYLSKQIGLILAWQYEQSRKLQADSADSTFSRYEFFPTIRKFFPTPFFLYFKESKESRQTVEWGYEII